MRGSAERISPCISFLNFGSAKSGTSSLHAYLNANRSFHLPRGIGSNDETGLFLANSEELSNRRIRRNRNDDTTSRYAADVASLRKSLIKSCCTSNMKPPPDKR